MIKLIFSFILLLHSSLLFAETYHCAHFEICKMAQILFVENKINTNELINIIIETGDPHEFEPSINDIKKLVTAPRLLVGPMELNPWMKKVLYQRSKNKNLKTYYLPLPVFARTEYPSNETESLGHFWLYPKIYCHLKTQMAEILNLKNLKCDAITIEKIIANDLSKLNIPLILTHDALLPLFNKLSSNKKFILAIKGSSHHEEVSSSAVKKVYDALTAPKVIWVIEKNITLSENIKEKIRPVDIVLNIDTGKANPIHLTLSDFAILEDLHMKLSEIK